MFVDVGQHLNAGRIPMNQLNGKEDGTSEILFIIWVDPLTSALTTHKNYYV